jgi:branched-chain amino acid transport system substrate-binding protein
MKSVLFLIASVSLLLLSACFSTQPDAIVLGVMVPLSGEHAADGEAVRQGVDLAVKEVNQRGFLQQPLRAVYEDSACDSDTAVGAAQELIIAHGVRVIIGGVCSDATVAVVDIVEQNNVVLISPGAVRDDVTKSDAVFRTIPSEALFADFVAETMYEFGYSKLAVLHHADEDSKAFAHFLEKQLAAVVVEEFDDLSDLRVQLTRIKANKPDALYLVDNGNNLFALLGHVEKAGLHVQLFSNSNEVLDSIIADPGTELAGDSAIEGLIIPSITHGNAVFTSLYERVYGEKPALYSAQSYDAVKVVAEALRSVPNLGLDIQEELHDVSITGATGEIDFDEHGNVAGNYAVFQVVNGTLIQR